MRFTVSYSAAVISDDKTGHVINEFYVGGSIWGVISSYNFKAYTYSSYHSFKNLTTDQYITYSGTHTDGNSAMHNEIQLHLFSGNYHEFVLGNSGKIPYGVRGLSIQIEFF